MLFPPAQIAPERPVIQRQYLSANRADCMIAVLGVCQHNGLTRALAWIVEGANLFQFSTDNKTQIDNMIQAVNRLHVENGRDIIAVDNVLLYFYTPDKRQNAREET